MTTYEINDETLAVIPKNDKTAIIYEEDRNFLVNQSADEIMEQSCEYFGSSLKGRQSGTTALTGITHKVPIIIEESSNIIFFPTTSPRLKCCCWVALNNIVSYSKENNVCKITFNDGKIITFDASYGIINNQILRASRLQMILDSRKRKKTSKMLKKDNKVA